MVVDLSFGVDAVLEWLWLLAFTRDDNDGVAVVRLMSRTVNQSMRMKTKTMMMTKMKNTKMKKRTRPKILLPALTVRTNFVSSFASTPSKRLLPCRAAGCQLSSCPCGL